MSNPSMIIITCEYQARVPIRLCTHIFNRFRLEDGEIEDIVAGLARWRDLKRPRNIRRKIIWSIEGYPEPEHSKDGARDEGISAVDAGRELHFAKRYRLGPGRARCWRVPEFFKVNSITRLLSQPTPSGIKPYFNLPFRTNDNSPGHHDEPTVIAAFLLENVLLKPAAVEKLTHLQSLRNLHLDFNDCLYNDWNNDPPRFIPISGFQDLTGLELYNIYGPLLRYMRELESVLIKCPLLKTLGLSLSDDTRELGSREQDQDEELPPTEEIPWERPSTLQSITAYDYDRSVQKFLDYLYWRHVPLKELHVEGRVHPFKMSSLVVNLDNPEVEVFSLRRLRGENTFGTPKMFLYCFRECKNLRVLNIDIGKAAFDEGHLEQTQLIFRSLEFMEQLDFFNLSDERAVKLYLLIWLKGNRMPLLKTVRFTDTVFRVRRSGKEIDLEKGSPE
ncbi:hypothetical protein G7Y89_g10366 [Cudoniella acicularis]|uniref:F-box domain-containing protein n=1 Tax=Cudoniella acicularis TaxID=354080 RepID=A0A8H4RFQ0_9HELO|nr:hypothetical protein G7Y89_g10366 [Cudoniella acicularis]